MYLEIFLLNKNWALQCIGSNIEAKCSFVLLSKLECIELQVNYNRTPEIEPVQQPYFF